PAICPSLYPYTTLFRSAVGVLQTFRPLAAAQEHELVTGPVGDEGPGQLHRHSQHPHPLGPPAGGDVDGESAHTENVREGKLAARKRPAGRNMVFGADFGVAESALPPF